MKWTAADIPDQRGRTVVVTGANSGLGRVVAEELARAGAQVVLACRDTDKGDAAAAQIAASAPRARVEVAALDLAALDSVRSFSDGLVRAGRRLDLLVNNAGVMAAPHGRTPDGFERQLGTNHLGHFALTGRLLPLLRARPGARVVTISSVAHRGGVIDFDDLQGERRYSRWGAYAQSKLANLLFALELDRRLRAAGSPLLSVAAHPGYAATNLQFSGPPPHERAFMRLGNLLFAQSAARGALPLLFAATARDLAGGSFVGPDGFLEGRGHPRLVSPSSSARDEAAARRLWDESERLTGVTFDFGQSSV